MTFYEVHPLPNFISKEDKHDRGSGLYSNYDVQFPNTLKLQPKTKRSNCSLHVNKHQESSLGSAKLFENCWG